MFSSSYSAISESGIWAGHDTTVDFGHLSNVFAIIQNRKMYENLELLAGFQNDILRFIQIMANTSKKN